jgi:multidrug efflux system outer membrane protein
MRESQQRQALYAYQRTLLNALREVEDSLVGLRSAGQQRTALGERVAAGRKVLELSELRYKGGVADYLEVLDAQRSLFDAEIAEATAASEHMKALIRLYKALGGGWPMPAAQGESKAPPQQGKSKSPSQQGKTTAPPKPKRG